MAREISGKPKTLSEALYLFDRGRLQVKGAQTRAEARTKLEQQYGKAKASRQAGTDDGSQEEPATDYGKWNVSQLEEELEERELSTEGKKADLVARLKRSDADELEDDDLLEEEEDGDEEDGDEDEE